MRRFITVSLVIENYSTQMNKSNLSVREIESKDIPLITHYWLTLTKEHHETMGVDVSKIPAEEECKQMLEEQIQQVYKEKKSYCIIWQLNGEAVGHSNINKIKFGEEAYMHLHLWNSDERMKGNGAAFVKMTLPWFFNNYHLQNLYCEPYALNTAPNKTLEKVGFKFIRQYRTSPGWINFEQEVNLWKLSKNEYQKMALS
jgi:RimJ/RimL family protein N-acetyltransferase